MPGEIATQDPNQSGQTADAGQLAGSAPAPQAAEGSGSAPENQPVNTGGQEPTQTPEGQGSEPGSEGAVQELKRQRKERQRLESENQYLRDVIEGKVQPQNTQQQPTQQQRIPGEPRLEDYDNYDDYNDARIEFALNRRQEQMRASQVISDYQARLAEAEKQQPGLTEKIETGRYPTNPQIQQAIMESDLGPQIAGYLADNQNVSEKLARLPVHSALREIGKIEGRLSSQTQEPQKTRQFTQAPPPITPATPSGQGVNKPLNEMSQDEFSAMRNKAQYGGG